MPDPVDSLPEMPVPPVSDDPASFYLARGEMRAYLISELFRFPGGVVVGQSMGRVEPRASLILYRGSGPMSQAIPALLNTLTWSLFGFPNPIVRPAAQQQEQGHPPPTTQA